MSEVPASRPPGNVDHVDALPVGARLGEFEIVGLLGVGGFGMVYQAFDHSLLRFVAIKEYMPASLAGRAQGRTIWVRSSADEPAFQAGLASFVEEARLLAQFDHSSLVKVFRFWEANHTAYMVMPLYAGMTLKQARANMRTPPPEEWLRKVIWSVCSALRVLHDGKTLHRDISPDNIFLQDNGPPVLLDLGAARFAIGDRDRKHTAVLKVNYAPIEQYADADGELKPGPWSDIYSLAAVIYGCICNDMPLPSTLRSIRDRMVPFARVARTVRKQFGVEYSAPFVETISKALSLQPRDRHWTVDDFLAQMGMTTAPANLDKFDFKAELGDIWVDEVPQAGASVLLDMGEGADVAPVARKAAHNTDMVPTVLHLPGTPPPLPMESDGRGAGAAEDFQDTVVRGMDFEDSRDEPYEAHIAAAATAAGSAAANVAGTAASAFAGVGPAGPKKPSSSRQASASPSRSGRSSSSGKSRNGDDRHKTAGRPRRALLASAAAALVLVAGSVAWFLSTSSATKAAPEAVQQAFVPTPDEEIVTEMAEANPGSQAASADLVLAADHVASAAASVATPVPAVKEPRKRAEAPRKVVEVQAAREEVHAPQPAPVAVPAPQPASQPPVVKRASPEESCADAGFLAKPMCIHNECQKPGMAGHPICVENKRRRDEERRQRQMYSQ